MYKKTNILINILIILNLNITLQAKCTPIVNKGMIVKNEHIEQGEHQTIYNGGKSINTVIEEDGIQIIYAKGYSKNTLIKHNGTQIIYSQGKTLNTKIIDGTQILYGGESNYDKIINDGLQIVFNGRIQQTTITNKQNNKTIFNGYLHTDPNQSLKNETPIHIFINGTYTQLQKKQRQKDNDKQIPYKTNTYFSFSNHTKPHNMHTK
ncbi:MAG: hypothetical protein LBM02_05105 [Lachnospiraceae bacterium]|jgi:autotransporter passenger strand-loop-strand repeat protein|nr:hypothetical protein [Lachnospiraceae bacterium]